MATTSNRLSQSIAFILSTIRYESSSRMQIIVKAQAFADPDSFSYATPNAEIMELNRHHAIVKEMPNLVSEGLEERACELRHLGYDTALISAGCLRQYCADYAKIRY
ncbi:unnamed protein product [Agarophyton chilense]